jgi:DNA-binding NarL/FixJ family response regulator
VRAARPALVDGLSAEEIADTQYVALTTVRSQIRAVLKSSASVGSWQLVAHAIRVGWSPKRAELSVE